MEPSPDQAPPRLAASPAASPTRTLSAADVVAGPGA